MTHSVILSAVTAEYASQPLKARARVSGVSTDEKSTDAKIREQTSQQGLLPGSEVTRTAALGDFFLQAGEKRQQQLYSQHAEEESDLPATEEPVEEPGFRDILELLTPSPAVPDAAGDELSL